MARPPRRGSPARPWPCWRWCWRAWCVLGELLMPWLVRGLATGFAPGSQQYELAVELGRITFPYLLLISLAALFASMLQAGQRFAAAAFAPVLLNLVLIAALLATRAEEVAARRDALAWGVLVAGVLQLAWVAVAAAARRARARRCSRRGCRPRCGGCWPADRARDCSGSAWCSSTCWSRSWFATHLPAGTVSYLFYADRLVQLPLGIVGVALGTALLPALSRAAREGTVSQRRAQPRAGAGAAAGAARRGGPRSAGPADRHRPVRAWGVRRRRRRWRPRRCWPHWRWACRPRSWPRCSHPASSPARTRRRRCGSRSWRWASTWPRPLLLTPAAGPCRPGAGAVAVELGQRAGPGLAPLAPRPPAARRVLLRRGLRHSRRRPWSWPRVLRAAGGLLSEPGLAALALVIGRAGGSPSLLAAWARRCSRPRLLAPRLARLTIAARAVP